MSNEMANHLEFKYGQLRSEFDEQMGHATAIMVHAGVDANAHINQLRLELENAEMSAKQEALAVGYANDRTCSLITCRDVGCRESTSIPQECYIIEYQATGN